MRNKISGVPHKHDHVSGRPRDYISRKKFYKGKHRGEYRPRPHWRCKTCTTSCNCPQFIGESVVKLHVYRDLLGEQREELLVGGDPSMVTLSFDDVVRPYGV